MSQSWFAGRALALACTVLVTFTGVASAQSGVSLSIDPSARSNGMGGAASAVFWGGDPNPWANPSLLGYHRGIRYSFSKYQLVPELASDIYFRSTRITAGAYGVGLSFAGLPDHLGGTRLDYGTVTFGSSILELWEVSESFAAGISIVELANAVVDSEAIRSVAGWGDLSIGWARNEVTINFPSGPALASTHANDFGLTLRVTPFDTVDRGGWGPALTAVGGLRFDVALAAAWLRYNDAVLSADVVPSGSPIPRDERFGLATRLSTGMPASWLDAFERRGVAWLAQGFAPFLALGLTWDRSDEHVEGSLQPGVYGVSQLYGAELAFANVVTLRCGYVDGRGIERGSWGLGLNLPIGDIAGIRYDHASAAQASDLDRRRDQSVTVFFDGVALAQQLR